MIWILLGGIFLFGLAAGSFLNVCIYRLPEEKSLIHPGSFCPVCSTTIKFYDNIPVLSFIILRGRCRNCSGRISFRYPGVELLTGILLVWLTYDSLKDLPLGVKLIPLLGIYVYITLGLITLSFIDIKHKIIPDEISFVGIPLAFVLSMIFPALHKGVPVIGKLISENYPVLNAAVSSFVGIIIGGGSLWLVGIVAKVLLKKEAMGFGDVKLMAMVGGLLGWLYALLIFFLACGIGSVIGIIILIKTKKHRIPFGPFLAAATYLVLLYGREILYFFTDIYPKFIRGVLRIG